MKIAMGRTTLVLSLSLILAALCACPQGWTIIRLDSDRYEPSLSGPSVYQGKKIDLLSFTNNSDETHPFYYYRPGEKLSYDTNGVVESYVWNCYRKAFRKAGMEVLENVQQAGTPDFNLTITHLTEGKFEYEVQVEKDGLPLLKKNYLVYLDPVKTMTDNPIRLEKYAYELMDKSVSKVLGDPEFQRVMQK